MHLTRQLPGALVQDLVERELTDRQLHLRLVSRDRRAATHGVDVRQALRGPAVTHQGLSGNQVRLGQAGDEEVPRATGLADGGPARTAELGQGRVTSVPV